MVSIVLYIRYIRETIVFHAYVNRSIFITRGKEANLQYVAYVTRSCRKIESDFGGMDSMET
jgi:hypothetical protein